MSTPATSKTSIFSTSSSLSSSWDWNCRITKSDLPVQEQTEVRAIVHQALVICKSYRECAAFCKLALERHFGDDSISSVGASTISSTWCVVVGRKVSFKVRQQRLHTCVLYAPGLALIEKEESKAKPFSVVIWRGSRDAEENFMERKSNENEEKLMDPLEIVSKVNSLLAGKNKLHEILQDKYQRELILPTLSVPDAGKVGGIRVLQSTVPSLSSLLNVISLVSLTRKTTGLDAKLDGVFLDSLKKSLTEHFGSTWHLLLSDSSQKDFDAIYEYETCNYKKDKKREENFINESFVYTPGYSISSASGFFIELSVLPAANVNTDTDSSTPERYSLCLYQSAPGEGEPSIEMNSSSAIISRLLLPGWDGRILSLPRAMWRNSVILSRTTLYAVALGCLSSYSYILFWYDNSCSRVLRPTVDALGVDLASLEARLLTTGPFSGAIARRLALGPLPPIRNSDEGDRVTMLMGKEETLSSGIRGALYMIAAAFRFVPKSERYFDSLLPRLPEDDDSFNELLETSGLSLDCSVADVIHADRRALQARALITCAVIVFLLASIVRVFSSNLGKSRFRGKLKGLAKSVTRKL